MRLLNVTSQVIPELEWQWMDWIQKNHIPKVMDTGCFVKTTLLKVYTDTPDFSTYAIQYAANSEIELERYLTTYESEFSKEIKRVFGENVLHFSTQLEIISNHP